MMFMGDEFSRQTTLLKNPCLTQNSVYIEGRSAKIHNVKRDQNHYNKETHIVDHSLWNKGWSDQS